MVASPFPYASVELDYPLYAVQFDPEDANRLAVGGGGGAGRSGVGNKISIIETSTQNELRVAGEIDLSRDEDSVMSLAFGPRKGKIAHLYAGVNSSPASIKSGTNQHLRTLAIEHSRSRASAGAKVPEAKIAEISRTSMFANPDADTYQRLLRVDGGMGAAATALGSDPQLAVFEANGPKPKVRGVMELPRDAEDLDVVQTGESEYQVAFCYKTELLVATVGSKESTAPQPIYSMPEENGVRPTFRSIKYLNPNFILVAANLPNRSGILLMGLRLPGPNNEKTRLAVTARVPGKISATALAVANLSPPASLTAPHGPTQFVIAVAGNDSSISVYTLALHPGNTLDLLIDLHPLHTLKDVHGSDAITGLSFSHFITPKTHLRPQFVKLASTSLQKSVAVHSIPLKKHIDKTPRNRKAPPRPVRYVVAMKSKGPSLRPVLISLTLMILLAAIGGQFIMEIYGKSPRTILHAHKFVTPFHSTTISPPDPVPSSLGHDHHFVSQLFSGSRHPTADEKFVMWESEHTPAPDTATGGSESGASKGDAGDAGVTPAPPQLRKIAMDIHDAYLHGPAKQWHELDESQKSAWKGRLKDAGHWTTGMGENVFQGILFGQIAEAVGHAVAG